MISYEWTAEAVDEYGDIQDNAFADTYAGIKDSLCAAISEPGFTIEIGLVRNRWNDIDGDLEDRQWAYIDEDGQLPSSFDGGAKVPKRFLAEVAR